MYLNIHVNNFLDQHKFSITAWMHAFKLHALNLSLTFLKNLTLTYFNDLNFIMYLYVSFTIYICMYIFTYRLFLERVNSSYVCIYMYVYISFAHSCSHTVIISYEWPHYLYSVTFHIWRLNSRKQKKHSVSDYPHSLPRDG